MLSHSATALCGETSCLQYIIIYFILTLLTLTLLQIQHSSRVYLKNSTINPFKFLPMTLASISFESTVFLKHHQLGRGVDDIIIISASYIDFIPMISMKDRSLFVTYYHLTASEIYRQNTFCIKLASNVRYHGITTCYTVIKISKSFLG